MKPIKGYEGLYSASKEGKIFGHKKISKDGKSHGNKFLKPWLIGHGYEMVMFYKNGEKPKKFLVHRLIAETFVPNPNNFPEVNHKDSNRRNNSFENLEWVTSSQNKVHAIKNGLYKKLFKLNEKQVKEIRSLYKMGKFTQTQLAFRFSTDQSNISDIILKNTWKHILDKS